MDSLAAMALLDLRVGRNVRRCEPSEGAKKPAYKLWIDFGSLGVKQSSQLTALYTPETLMGRLVIAAVNLGTRKVNGFTSEVLVLGLPDEKGNVVLLTVERDVPLGGRVY